MLAHQDPRTKGNVYNAHRVRTVDHNIKGFPNSPSSPTRGTETSHTTTEPFHFRVIAFHACAHTCRPDLGQGAKQCGTRGRRLGQQTDRCTVTARLRPAGWAMDHKYYSSKQVNVSSSLEVDFTSPRSSGSLTAFVIVDLSAVYPLTICGIFRGRG
ncbi:hypothetical protein PoB_001929000 [Plakobranchus ocellatus]|uniref:Uncharacterized protein n=1 Tax=Plakobranchus ocellatus TaxID=259542 RepID=A0AAV3ZDZ7_9GAST|nr:hypothetical protein PoB_001929000 [Plakobranchus ocellatus]